MPKRYRYIDAPGGREVYAIHYLSRIPYAERPTRTLYMDMLTPCRPGKPTVNVNGFDRRKMDPAFGDCSDIRPSLFRPEQGRHPVILYVQGSGFSGRSGFTGLPLLSELVRDGYIAVTADYRGAAMDDTRFPDAIQDIKEAVRFLRANADKYAIDPERIALMGSSSCGYTVMFCAVTGDDPAFFLGENREYSSQPQAVIDLFGPADFETIVEDRIEAGRSMGSITEEAYSLFRNDVVGHPELLATASVLRRITPVSPIPPVLILHGDRDRTIPLHQSERLYERLLDAGKEAELCVVRGGGHEVDFWGPETMVVLRDFLKRTLE